MEGGDVNDRVAQRWFQRFKTGEVITKYLPCFGKPKLWVIENIHRVLENNPQKKYSWAVRTTWCIKRYYIPPD